MAGLINLGVQALNANQLALDITGQNIANVNTPGYSRQSVEFSSRGTPQFGVSIEGVQRAADMFATRQVWTDTAKSAASDAFVQQANQLDDALASSSTSISAAMDEFFVALQNGVDDPSSIPSREVILAEAEALAQRFNSLDNFFASQNDTIIDRVQSQVSDVSQMAGQLAALNEKISFSEVRNERTSELHDKREELVRQLSDIIGVTTQVDGDNLNVYVGNGQPLVIGSNASRVSTVAGNPDPDDLRISVNVSGNEIFIGEEITSGTVGGLLSYRDEVLEPAWNELGRLATVFADTLNTQHKAGMDLDNNLGINLFKDLNHSGEVIAFNNNSTDLAANPTVAVTDSAKLKASDYVISFSDSDKFVITRTSDGQRFRMSDFSVDGTDPVKQADMSYFADPANGSLRLSLDGITINLETQSGFVKGDQFLVKPVRDGAEDLALNLTSGRQLAFASPVRGTAAVDNSGSAEIASIDITDPENDSFTLSKGALTPPAEIVFNAGTPQTYSVLDVSDPDNPVPYTSAEGALTGIPYSPGDSIELNGYTVSLEGVPNAGDSFTFGYNTDGVSDNKNAARLSELQQAQLVEESSYQDIYGLMVERVGTETRVAQLDAEANSTVLKNSTAARDSIAGVNLDEEGANLLKFQQAYQASAQLISASRTLFDTLLSVSGG